jgi:hypothetical protein
MRYTGVLSQKCQTLVISNLITLVIDEMTEDIQHRAEKIIRDNDSRKFEGRVKRWIEIIELGAIEFASFRKSPPHYLWNLLKEAADDFQEGCFRSCIFICASVAEQILKHELIQSSTDPEEKQWEIEIRRKSYSDLINESEKLPSLKSYVGDARWLRDARNLIAAHPLYVGVYEKDDTQDRIIWKNKTMIRNIRKTLELFDNKDRESILDFKITYEDKSEVKLRDALKDPTFDHASVIWSGFSEDAVLEFLALGAYQRMKKIVEGVYPVDPALHLR